MPASTDHTLIFDEDYYVNAARVIDRIRPPAGAPYANSPLGTDPNSEHPPLAKLVIAGGIELFGDGPIAWRLPSVLLGTVAILGMFALVRAAAGGAGRRSGPPRSWRPTTCCWSTAGSGRSTSTPPRR